MNLKDEHARVIAFPVLAFPRRLISLVASVHTERFYLMHKFHNARFAVIVFSLFAALLVVTQAFAS
ncbi:MAG: hypothetical protein KF726_15055, partial [Anaerolineae bacterium]|nr:hypothetical protein [Anaerolineae bacterium]